MSHHGSVVSEFQGAAMRGNSCPARITICIIHAIKIAILALQHCRPGADWSVMSNGAPWLAESGPTYCIFSPTPASLWELNTKLSGGEKLIIIPNVDEMKGKIHKIKQYFIGKCVLVPFWSGNSHELSLVTFDFFSWERDAWVDGWPLVHCAGAAPEPLRLHPLHGRRPRRQHHRHGHHAQVRGHQSVQSHAQMFRQKTSRKFHSETWKTNLFLLSLSVSTFFSTWSLSQCVQVSDLLLVTVAVPTQLLQYFSVQVVIWLREK